MQDRRWIVSGSDDYSVRVWDAETGAELLQLQGHTGSIMSVAVFADGVVTRSASGRALAWALPSGEPTDPASIDPAFSDPEEEESEEEEEGEEGDRASRSVPFAVCLLPGGGSLLAVASPARGLSVERIPPFRCTRRIARMAPLEARGARVDAGTALEPRLRRLLLQLGALEAGGAAAAGAGAEGGKPVGQQR
eukprot:tig00000523_g1859.t1